MRIRGGIALACMCVSAVVLSGCAGRVATRRLVPLEERGALVGGSGSAHLKVHLRNGDLAILSGWRVDENAGMVTGLGDLLGPDRAGKGNGAISIPLDDVALFETTTITRSSIVAAMGLLTVATAAVTAICITNPKTCFGSCPTFYLDDTGGSRPDAEGFSASVAPCLEATDIDALRRARGTPATDEIRLIMRNEALETHVVRYADLLVAPRPRGGRVFAAVDGTFRAARTPVPPRRATAPEGDCTAALAAADGNERTSLADSTHLDAREEIVAEFAAMPGDSLGLVIAARQSLMITYVFYQALAWLGSTAGDWFARLERGEPGMRPAFRGPGAAIGGIDIAVDSGNGWREVATLVETGPLAEDVHLVPVAGSAAAEPIRVRIRLTRGAWRLDWIALTELGTRVDPVRIAPRLVRRGAIEDAAALGCLRDRLSPLVTLPGDDYELVYSLRGAPPDPEFFLESRGYYLEWMRPEWLEEENPALAMRLFLDPAGSLADLAPAWKRVEPEAERAFWSSRYGQD